MDELTNEIKRCKAKLTRLENADQVNTEAYRYWRDRFVECERARFEQAIRVIEQQHGPVTLEKKIIANGALQVTAYANGHYVQHLSQAIIPAQVLEMIPLTADFRTNNPPCAVCGKLGTELHHWAPQHLFVDAWQWPTDYLCKQHHDEWHNTILKHWRNGNGK